MMTATVVGGLLGYLFHFVVSRQLSVSQYGELQSLLSLSIIFGVFNSALSYFAVKYASVFAAHDDRAANLGFSDYFTSKIFKFAGILLVVLIISSPILSRLLHFSSYLGFFVISFATFISAMAIIYSEILRGWQEFVLLSLIGIITAVTKLVSGAVLACLSHKASVVSFSFLAIALINWYLMKRWYRKKIANAENPDNSIDWKEKYFPEANAKKTVVSIFFFSLALILVSNLDVVLVKYFSSAEMTGRYGAFALIGKIVLWLNLSVVGVMLPGAIADGHSGKRPEKHDLLKSYGLTTFIALGLISAYYLMPNFITNIFFGKKYVLDTQVLWMFGLMSYLLSILTLEANLSFAKHDFRVVYFLAATIFLMIGSLAKYHASLEQIVLAMSASFLLGYFSVTMLNLSHEKTKKINS